MTNQNKSIGISAIAVHFPDQIRTNDYWKKNYPDFLENLDAKNTLKIFENKSSSDKGKTDFWYEEMQPYLKDIFRGTKERRIMSAEENSLTMEKQACQKALAEANLNIDEIDLLITVSMFPEKLIIGDSAFLAGMLEFKGPAFSLNANCGGNLVALDLASDLIKIGKYKKVLIALSCTYSRFFDEEDTFSFSLGDGSAAFIVSEVENNKGIIASHIVSASETCGVVYNEHIIDKFNKPKFLIKANAKGIGKNFPALAKKYFEICIKEALEKANLSLEDIDFFVFYAATAWQNSFYAKTLNIPLEKTIDIFPEYGNISAVSAMAALYKAASQNKIKENDLVLIYSHGFSGSCAATIMRWGDDVKLGSMPIKMENQLLEVSDKVLV